jgi:hypothetical protein
MNTLQKDFKQDFDRILPTELEWDANLLFFWVDDNIYYYKPHLESSINGDFRRLIADRATTEKRQMAKDMAEDLPGWAGSPCGQQSISQIRRVINASPEGMPKFVQETENFFVFEMKTRKMITIANITPEIVDYIEQSFGEEFGPYYNNMARGMYIDGKQVYWTAIYNWAHYNKNRPLPYKGGVFMKEDTDPNVHLYLHIKMDSDLVKRQIDWMKRWEFGDTPMIIHDKQ